MFPPSDYVLPSINIFVGRPRSGKSYAIRYLLTYLSSRNEFNYGLVFTNTSFNKDYDYIPDKYKYTGFNRNIIARLMKYQSQNRHLRCFVVLDDLLGSISPNDPLLTSLISTYRHYNITIFITAQYLKKLSTVFRECCSYWYIFNTVNENSVKALKEDVFTDARFDKTSDLKKFIQQHTNGYYFIFVDTSRTDGNGKYMSVKIPNYEKVKIEY